MSPTSIGAVTEAEQVAWDLWSAELGERDSFIEAATRSIAELIAARDAEIARLQEIAYVATRRKEEVEGRGITLQAAIELANHERFKAEEEIARLRGAQHYHADCETAHHALVEVEARVAQQDAEIARLRSSIWTDYIEADTHNEMVRKQDDEIARLTAITVAYWTRFGAVPEDGANIMAQNKAEIARLRGEVAFFAERLETQDHQYSHGHPAAARYRALRETLERERDEAQARFSVLWAFLKWVEGRDWTLAQLDERARDLDDEGPAEIGINAVAEIVRLRARVAELEARELKPITEDPNIIDPEPLV